MIDVSPRSSTSTRAYPISYLIMAFPYRPQCHGQKYLNLNDWCVPTWLKHLILQLIFFELYKIFLWDCSNKYFWSVWWIWIFSYHVLTKRQKGTRNWLNWNWVLSIISSPSATQQKYKIVYVGSEYFFRY